MIIIIYLKIIFLFIIGFKNIEVNNIEKFFDLKEYEKKVSLSDYLGKNFWSFRILTSFAMFDITPFAMSSHTKS